jgi:hypothetical protein
VVELARLESEYTPKGYRGFESPSLRQKQKIIPPFWRVFCFLTMAVMPWYEQTAEENNIILGNAQDDFLLLKHCRGGSRAKRVIPFLRDTIKPERFMKVLYGTPKGITSEASNPPLPATSGINQATI